MNHIPKDIQIYIYSFDGTYKNIYNNVIKEIISLKWKKLKILLNFLRPSRYDNFSECLVIGYILYKIGDGCDEALQLWSEFSSQNNKFDQLVCNKIWKNMMTIGFMTFETLWYYAVCDNRLNPDFIIYKQTNPLKMYF